MQRFLLHWSPPRHVVHGLVAVLALNAICVACARAADRPPNVVLIITDDQGYGDLHCHGNEMISTPNLDRLYRQSVRLTNFHVDPTCAETRSALMTGRYSTRVGVWHTIMGRSLLARDEQTMADVFAQNGYRTGMFGKWHLGDNYPLRPQDRGFQSVLSHGGGGVGQTPDYWGNDYFDDTYFANGKPEKQQGYCTDVWFQAATEFIAANRERPFFCYISTNAPHSPYHVAEKYSRPYEEQGAPPAMANFYGMITNIDENVGRLMDQLDRWKLADNTLVIFMTDNGTAAGVARRAKPNQWSGFNAGMRGRKGSQYEGGHRVPCFVRLPGRTDGRDAPQLTAHLDLLPTLIDLCGLEKPQAVQFDGASLHPLLENDSADWPQRTLLVHSQRIEHPEKWRKCSVMSGRWRLVDGRELYDLKSDPGQQKNVAEDHPALVKELREAYERWWDDLSPAFDRDVRIELGAPEATKTTLTAHDWRAPQPQVPWNQPHIERGLRGNGWWAVEVVEEGEYKITLRRWPPEKPGELEAVQAALSVGELELEQEVATDAGEAAFQMQLPAGPTRLQTRLTDQDGQSRGAYYVTVERLD